MNDAVNDGMDVINLSLGRTSRRRGSGTMSGWRR
jgi:hypothetical protein